MSIIPVTDFQPHHIMKIPDYILRHQAAQEAGIFDPMKITPTIKRDKHGTGWDCENRNAFFDHRGCRSWILTTRDSAGNQIGDAEYCHVIKDAMKWLKTGSLAA
jgi:hypothetical protein